MHRIWTSSLLMYIHHPPASDDMEILVMTWSTMAILDDGKMFDISYNRGKALSFRVGVGEVIKGCDEGILGGERIPPMPAGDKNPTCTWIWFQRCSLWMRIVHNSIRFSIFVRCGVDWKDLWTYSWARRCKKGNWIY